MSLTKLEADTIDDYNRANHYAEKYIARFLVQVNARGLMIDSAAGKFAKFLGLPPTSSKLGAILDIAFAVVSTAIPFLKLTNLVRNAEIAIGIAETAQIAAPKMARAVKAIEKGNEAVIKSIETGKSVHENVKGIREEEPAGVAELAKLDTRKGPIRELVSDAAKAVTLWERTLDLLDRAENLRLAREIPGTKSLMALAQDILKLPELFTADELDQIELAYLFQMIGEYARSNVTIVKTVTNYGRDDGYAIEGLNNTQIDTIIELFGGSEGKGKYFSMPPVWSVYFYLSMWSVRETVRTVQVHHTGRNNS